MSHALNGRSAIQRFEGNDAIEICDGITFDFYTRLPHRVVYITAVNEIYNPTEPIMCNVTQTKDGKSAYARSQYLFTLSS